MQEMPFQRPKIQKISSLLPKVTKFLDPPLHINITSQIFFNLKKEN